MVFVWFLRSRILDDPGKGGQSDWPSVLGPIERASKLIYHSRHLEHQQARIDVEIETARFRPPSRWQ